MNNSKLIFIPLIFQIGLVDAFAGEAPLLYMKKHAAIIERLGVSNVASNDVAFRLGILTEYGELSIKTIVVYDKYVHFVIDHQLPFKAEVSRTSIRLYDVKDVVGHIGQLPSFEDVKKLSASRDSATSSLVGGTIFFQRKDTGGDWVGSELPVAYSGTDQHINAVFKLFQLVEIKRQEMIKQPPAE